MFKLIGFVLFILSTSQLLAGTGYFKGEETSGLNKICYYAGASGKFAKTIKSYQVCPTSAEDGRSTTNSYNNNYNSQQNTISIQVTGYLSGERTSGLNKICYYNSSSGTFTKTVASYQVCPVSAKK